MPKDKRLPNTSRMVSLAQVFQSSYYCHNYYNDPDTTQYDTSPTVQ